MTIQTDYEEIEKGCGRLVDNEYAGTTPVGDYYCSKEELCSECVVKKQTFITENLKRINEMIAKLNDIWTILVDKTYDHEHIENCWLCNLIDDIRSDLIRLEADKIFLEEKR